MNNIGLRMPTAGELKQKQLGQRILRQACTCYMFLQCMQTHSKPMQVSSCPKLNMLRCYTIRNPGYLGSGVQILPNHNGYYVLEMKVHPWIAKVAEQHGIKA